MSDDPQNVLPRDALALLSGVPFASTPEGAVGRPQHHLPRRTLSR